MDLNFTAEEQAFRQEVRSFLRAKLPAELSSKVLGGKRMAKSDFVRWQKILHAQGWGAGAITRDSSSLTVFQCLRKPYMPPT